MPQSGVFKFVHIPADPSEPIEELSQEYTEENSVQCLLDRLKVRPPVHYRPRHCVKAAR
jgi:hypothetical protein